MVHARVKTIEELEQLYYGAGAPFIAKADQPILTTTPGYYRPLFGRKVWVQLNLEANVFSAIPREPWNQSGWRVLRSKPTDLGTVSEGGSIPDTLRPDLKEINFKPATVAHGFNVSEVAEYLAGVDDSLGSVMVFGREFFGNLHKEANNRHLMTEADSWTAGQPESLDKIVSSISEQTTCTAPDTATYAANAHDLYGGTIDRDSGGDAWADSQVLHNQGTLRPLTLSLIDELFERVWSAGGNPKVMITGYDTLRAIQSLLQAQQRFIDTAKIVATFQGVKAPTAGVEAGFYVATYNGVPIIPTKDGIKDVDKTSGEVGLSRIFLLDTDYLKITIAKPTQYFEAGISTGNPFAINFFGDEGLYRTMYNVRCYWFAAQGKLRDIKYP